MFDRQSGDHGAADISECVRRKEEGDIRLACKLLEYGLDIIVVEHGRSRDLNAE
jgi:hypothetical protein